MIFLISCILSAPIDADAERLFAAEIAPPVNSSAEPDAVDWSDQRWRLAELGAFLRKTPEAREKIALLDDYLRAHTEATVEQAWPKVQAAVAQPGIQDLTVGPAPYKLAVAIARIEALPPNWEATVTEIQQALQAQGVTTQTLHSATLQNLRLMRDGQAVGTLDAKSLSSDAFGWIVAQEGKAPVWVDADSAETVLEDMRLYWEAKP